MFVLLFLLWLVLNGGWSLQIAGAGVLAAGLVAWGCQRVLGLPFWGGRKLWQRILRAVGYLPLLLREVWTANLQVILRILCPGRRRGAPRLSWVDPGLREPGTQFLLANSITPDARDRDGGAPPGAAVRLRAGSGVRRGGQGF